jgi:hypothetical protein
MGAPEDTRRCIVERTNHERWLARPFDDPNGQEVIVLSKAELLHALPCCDTLAEKPPAGSGTLYVVTAPTLNVRVTPSTAQAPVGTLRQGDQVWCVAANVSGWLRIERGAYAGKFIAAAYARPM